MLLNRVMKRARGTMPGRLESYNEENGKVRTRKCPGRVD